MTITIEGVQARFKTNIDDKHGVLLYRGYTTPIKNIGEGFCCWIGLEPNTGEFLVGGMLVEIAENFKRVIDDYVDKNKPEEPLDKAADTSKNPSTGAVSTMPTSNPNETVFYYKGYVSVAHAVYGSGISIYYPAIICWAGRVDTENRDIKHEEAYAGVTIEEAAEQFKNCIDSYETIKNARLEWELEDND